MIGRATCRACLVLALWALLFAPGAMRAGAADDGALPHTDRLAAAVLAPTFGSDAMVLRAPRQEHDDASEVDDGLPAPDDDAVPSIVDRPATPVELGGPAPADLVDGHRTRGPPAS